MKMRQLLFASRPYEIERREFVDDLAPHHDIGQELDTAAAVEFLAAERVVGVNNQNPRMADIFRSLGQSIRLHVTLIVVEPPHLLDSRVGHLFRVAAELDLGLAVMLHHFVHAAQGATAFTAGRHKVGPYALVDDVGNDELVELVGDDDLHIVEAGAIEHLAGPLAEERQIPAVDANPCQPVAPLFQFLGNLDRILQSALQHIIGVHQQDAVIREGSRIRSKSLELGSERLHPAVGVRSSRRHSKGRATEQVGGAVRPTDIGPPARPHGPVRPLRPAQAELHDGSVSGSLPQARCLGSHKRLKVDMAEQYGLYHLALDQPPCHLDQRLVRKDDGAFRYGADVPLESKLGETLEECFRKEARARRASEQLQEGNILVAEAQRHHGMDGILQPRCYGITAAKGVVTKIQVECRRIVRIPLLQVAGTHRELIEVG